jgi:hypothetical protein
MLETSVMSLRARRRATPAVTAALAAAAAVFALAGCGSGSPSKTIGSGKGTATDRYQQLVLFSECMRAHGLPSFPDPVQNGNGVGLQIRGGPGAGGLKPDSPAFQTAQKACAHLLPNGGRPPGPMSAAQQQRFLNYAKCLRTHGVPSFPDPVFSGGGVQVRIGGPGVDPSSPAFKTAQKACQSMLPFAKFGGP